MGISKTEINLRRLLQAAPKQQNQAKLIHYVSTSRELLEQLAAETTPEGLPRVSKAKVNDYSDKIESIAAKLAASLDDDSQVLKDPSARTEIKETTEIVEEEKVLSSPPGLRKRAVPSSSSINDRPHNNDSSGDQSTVKLDDAAVTHIDKHRKLQEDLTDEMVGLARQLKESSLMMSRSVQNTEKILDSTEKAVEQSLASTGHATARATQVFSQSSKTSCLTWLLMFFMICVFIMVVLLIRIT